MVTDCHSKMRGQKGTKNRKVGLWGREPLSILLHCVNYCRDITLKTLSLYNAQCVQGCSEFSISKEKMPREETSYLYACLRQWLIGQEPSAFRKGWFIIHSALPINDRWFHCLSFLSIIWMWGLLLLLLPLSCCRFLETWFCFTAQASLWTPSPQPPMYWDYRHVWEAWPLQGFWIKTLVFLSVMRILRENKWTSREKERQKLWSRNLQEASLITCCLGNHYPKQVAQTTGICLLCTIIRTRNLNWAKLDSAFILHSINLSYMVVFR